MSYYPPIAAMKRIALMMDAGMPDPPSVDEFIGVLRNVMQSPEDNTDALLGEISTTTAKARKLCNKYKSAVRAFLDYVALCEAQC